MDGYHLPILPMPRAVPALSDKKKIDFESQQVIMALSGLEFMYSLLSHACHMYVY